MLTRIIVISASSSDNIDKIIYYYFERKIALQLTDIWGSKSGLNFDVFIDWIALKNTNHSAKKYYNAVHFVLWRARWTVLQLTCHVWITYSVKLKDHDLLCFTELANTHRAKCCRYQQAKGVQQDWSNAGPAFATLSQHWTNLGWTFLVCWETTPQSKGDYLSALPIRRTVEWICLGNSAWISQTFMHLKKIIRDNLWS